MLNNTISQLNAEQWSRTYTLWLPWHQLIHCYLDNCKFLYTYQLACTLTTELLLPIETFGWIWVCKCTFLCKGLWVSEDQKKDMVYGRLFWDHMTLSHLKALYSNNKVHLMAHTFPKVSRKLYYQKKYSFLTYVKWKCSKSAQKPYFM